MKIQFNSTKIINVISVLMILVMAALLFMPYWQYESTERIDGEKVTVSHEISINDYVWFPKEHKGMTKVFEGLYENKKDYFINDLVTAPALVLVVGVLLGLFSLTYSKLPLSALLALILGVVNANGYMTRPEMQLGSACNLHLTISVITAAIGAVGVVWFIVSMFLKAHSKKKAKKALAAKENA